MNYINLTSSENNIAEVFGSYGSCHLSACQLLPYPWLLPAQIMDSGQWQFLIYWLQAKQRVTAVFSNQQKDLWCLPSAALCQRHLASPGFVAPPQRIFWFSQRPEADPPCGTCCGETDSFADSEFYISCLFSCFKSKYFWAISTCWVGCFRSAEVSNHASLAEGRSLPGAYLALPEFRWLDTIFKNNCTHSSRSGVPSWHRNSLLSHHVF